MDQIQSAALSLAGVTLAFLLLAFLGSRWLRNRGAPKPPKSVGASQPQRESKLPKLPRRNRAVEAPVEISPARLARISRKTPLAETAPHEEADLLIAERPAPRKRRAARRRRQGGGFANARIDGRAGPA